jgi:hypothetical protein
MDGFDIQLYQKFVEVVETSGSLAYRLAGDKIELTNKYTGLNLGRFASVENALDYAFGFVEGETYARSYCATLQV